MFDITPDDIALLDDKALRTLVGRLCESEMRKRGLPVSAVTYGGDQNAADGGIDVQIDLPASADITGYIPRPVTGFQVKNMDMPPAEITAEMRPLPTGVLRPSIRKLADQSGAYIIVSSSSVSHSMLEARLLAMTKAVEELPNGGALKLEFYDRTRLTSWVRDHAGLVPWIRETIGRAIPGWRSYGAWAYSPEGASGEYLLDETLRIETGKKEDGDGLSATGGIQHMRDLLNQPGKVVRLVGLSGVGKTRFVQALFDDRVGQAHLDPWLAVYTNMGDGPDPQPTGLASDLIAAGTRAILIIDNCTPELHRRLSEVCRSPGSRLSVVTVEYDVTDDQPEGTEVFRLEPSSIDVIERLVAHRFPELSQINVSTVAEHSGGNARIAIAIASTIGKTETISGLTDDELFRRLVQQGHGHDDSLLRAAQACSLVYSFQGEDVSALGDDADLSRIGTLIGANALEVFRSVAELRSRDLVQTRGVWRAVLPHALANHLAKSALRNIPFSLIEGQLINGVPARVLKSFSRRLGYLSDSTEAVTIVKSWLAPAGLLGTYASNLNELGKAMFENVAPVAPEAALAAVESALLAPEDSEVLPRCAHFIRLLRLLAHDALLFERCATLLVKFAIAAGVDAKPNEGKDVFLSLFSLYYSGTHATIDQRLIFAKHLLVSTDPNERSLGLLALKAVFEDWPSGSHYGFEFGARARDYGYWPKSGADVKRWFGEALKLAESLACSELPCAPEVRTVVAGKFRGLWTMAGMIDELENVCRAISAKHFWREGWIAVRETQHFDTDPSKPEDSARLSVLEGLLRPASLLQKVRSMVLSNRHRSYDLGDFEEYEGDDSGTAMERIDTLAQSLGKAVAADEQIFGDLLEELLTGSGHLRFFGRGLAEGAKDPNAIWARLRDGVAMTAEGKCNFEVLRGFLNWLQTGDAELANLLLDKAVQDEILAKWYPFLEAALQIDQKGFKRLMRSLVLGTAPAGLYQNLAYGRATDLIPPQDLKTLALEIASKPDGLEAAVEIIYMRLHFGADRTLGHPVEVIEAGRALMQTIPFAGRDDREDYRLGEICRSCLAGDAGAAVISEICGRLKDAVASHATHPYYHDDLLVGLFSVQPTVALDGLCAGDAEDLKSGIRIIDDVRRFKKNLLDLVPETELFAWCDHEPTTRYPAVAAALPISTNAGDAGGPRQWTNIALRLLERAPDRIEVLRQFVRQFRPSSWSGSRAAILEANARLLDELQGYPDATVVAFIAQEKARLAHDVENERRLETSSDRDRDARFE